ncbi:Endonuclease/exonuclease/phosphatase [Lactifluus subvellereus]|nr:Endonuclease/exonuclease/phosphatase [Lactifluus subvellereus]
MYGFELHPTPPVFQLFCCLVKNSYQAESYRWLEPYTLHPASWLSVKPPRDLRNACQPVHTYLSLGCAGMPVGDTADYVKIRDDWLWSRSQSLATVRQDSEEKQLMIRLGTFNVNGKLPSQDLSTWLVGGLPSPSAHNNERKRSIPPFGELSPPSPSGKSAPSSGKETEQQTPKQPTPSTTTLEADMLVVAFQELDLSTEALFYSVGPAREDAWTAAILAALGEKAEQYEKLVSKQLVGILLIVLVKRDLRDCFSEVRESSVAVGIMVSANKGAVAVRLNYQPKPTSSVQSPIPVTLTFVNSHLAAFHDQVERRNADFYDISRRLEFGPYTEYVWNPRSEDIGVGPPTLDMYASDVLFWLVNLNYRLNLPDTDVRHLLCLEPISQGIPALLQFDQLRSSIRRGTAFADFGEYPIAFLPTYRFNATMQTDALGYDTKRTPAWTDRILYKSSPFVPVSQRSYNGHPSITMSDHKPVSAEFLVGIPCIDSMVLDMAANDLYKSIASFDPEDPSSIPLLKLDKASLEFGKVFYSTPASQNLSIRNVGKVPATFRFFPRDLSSPIHPRWLKIEPMTGFLLPEEEKTLQLTIFVSHAAAAPLNLRIQKLSTLLIIHTLLGQDLFLSLDGEYEPSCFGTSLSALARLPGPIRELRRAEDLLPEAQAHGSPREFMRLIGWLMSHDQPRCARSAATNTATQGCERELIVRQSLDTGTELPPCPAPTPPQTVDPNYARTVATVLLEFFRSLPESIVPFSLHQRCAEVTSRDAAFEVCVFDSTVTTVATFHLCCSRCYRSFPRRLSM